MKTLCRLVMASALLLLPPARAEAAFGVVPGVAGTFPATANAPDVMVGGTAFYEILPWLVLRGGAYNGASLWHFPLSVGYVLPQKSDFQLRPRLEVGLDPWYDPTDAVSFGSEWHVGLGLDYLPFDDHWVIGSSIQLILGQLEDEAFDASQGRPVVGPWLVRAELGVGYKF